MGDDRGLGIWFKDGIENILLAIDEANLDMVNCFPGPEVRIYRQGYAAALRAVATAFGIGLVTGAACRQLLPVTKDESEVGRL